MPAVTRDPSKKTVYLDTNIYIYAYRSRMRRGGGFDRLDSLIQNVAQVSNLCVSATHAVELCRGSGQNRIAFAEWLDTLPLVWMTSKDAIERDEFEVAIRATHAMKPGVGPQPFGKSMLSVLENMSVEEASSVLANASFREWFRQVTPSHIEMREREVVQMYEEIRKDAEWVRKNKIPAKELVRVRSLKLNNLVQAIVRNVAAERRLIAELAMNDRQLEPELVVTRVAQAPAEFAMFNLYNAVVHKIGEEIRAPGIAPARFSDRVSDTFDLAHLVGAAHCDVYVCEKAMASRLRQMNLDRAKILRTPPNTEKLATDLARDLGVAPEVLLAKSYTG